MKFEKDSEFSSSLAELQVSTIPVSAIILAGGSGSRMGGISKSNLTLGNETFINRNIRSMEKIVCEIVISVVGSNLPDLTDYTGRNIPVHVVVDESKGHGPLMGILSALKASKFEINFITTVDSPFVSISFAKYLIQGLGKKDAHVPIWNGYPEPLFAVYRKSCIPFIQESLQENKRKIVSFYDKIAVKYADSEVVKKYDEKGLSFININTQEEYRKLIHFTDL